MLGINSVYHTPLLLSTLMGIVWVTCFWQWQTSRRVNNTTKYTCAVKKLSLQMTLLMKTKTNSTPPPLLPLKAVWKARFHRRVWTLIAWCNETRFLSTQWTCSILQMLTEIAWLTYFSSQRTISVFMSSIINWWINSIRQLVLATRSKQKIYL